MMDFRHRAPTSLDNVRDSLSESARAHDFLGLLRQHHVFLLESIDRLLDAEAMAGEKQGSLQRLLRLLNMHGRAEEETLYLRLRNSAVKNARMQGLVGHDEHDIAFQLGDELEELGFDSRWTEEIDAKAKVLALTIQNHIREEERDMFPVAAEYLKAEDLNSDVPSYLLKCRAYLETDLSSPRISTEDPPSLSL